MKPKQDDLLNNKQSTRQNDYKHWWQGLFLTFLHSVHHLAWCLTYNIYIILVQNSPNPSPIFTTDILGNVINIFQSAWSTDHSTLPLRATDHHPEDKAQHYHHFDLLLHDFYSWSIAEWITGRHNTNQGNQTVSPENMKLEVHKLVFGLPKWHKQ